MIKIAYIGIKGLPAQAGVDRVVESILSHLDRAVYEPTVYVDKDVVPSGTTIPGVRLVRVPTLKGKHSNATSLFLLAALHALFLGNYDLINLHSVETGFVLPILRLRYPVISTAHGVVPEELTSKWGRGARDLMRLTEYPFMYLSNLRTSVSRPDKAYLEKRYGREVIYLPNGIEKEVDVDREGACRALARHDLEPGRYIVFSAGRVIPRKGCHYVLEALRDMDEDVKLLVIGDLSHEPEYEQQLRRLADDRVRFYGFVSSKELLFGLIAQAQLFLFPTTYEAMAMTMLEVAALGVPMIASDIPENKEVLPDEALYFKNKDVADLRARLQWALANPTAMQTMAVRARQRLADQFLWDPIVGKYDELYRSLI